jgi:hypothetical protein
MKDDGDPPTPTALSGGGADPPAVQRCRKTRGVAWMIRLGWTSAGWLGGPITTVILQRSRCIRSYLSDVLNHEVSSELDIF